MDKLLNPPGSTAVAIVAVVAVVTAVILLIMYFMKKCKTADDYKVDGDKCVAKEAFQQAHTARLQQVQEGGLGSGATTWGNYPLANISGFRSGFSTGREPPVFWPQGDVAATRGARSPTFEVLSEKAGTREVDGKKIPIRIQQIRFSDGTVTERVLNVKQGMTVRHEDLSADEKLIIASQGFRSY